MEAKAGWKKEGQQLVDRLLREEADEAKLVRKGKARMERLSAWKVLHGLNWQLAMCGRALSHFKVDSNDTREIHLRPHLTIVSDTGSDMSSLIAFLQQQRDLRMNFLPDPFHRCWRAVWNATRSCHLWGAALVAAIVLNYHHGPFQSQAWWTKLQETALEVSALAGKHDPILYYLQNGLSKDRLHRENVDQVEDPVQEALTELPDAYWLRRKGPRVATTRWGTIHHGLQDLLRHWHHKLAILIAWGSIEGWLEKGKGQLVMQKLRTSSTPTEDEKSVNHHMQNISKLRDSFRNTSQLVTWSLSNSDFYFDANLLLWGGRPFMLWQAELNKRLRVEGESVRVCLEISCYEGLSVTWSTVSYCLGLVWSSCRPWVLSAVPGISPRVIWSKTANSSGINSNALRNFGNTNSNSCTNVSCTLPTSPTVFRDA